MTFFLGLGALLVLWLGSREVIRGRITLGEFVAFNAYLTMLSWPMIAFGWVTNMLQRGMASWKRMLEVLDARAGDRRRAPCRRPAVPSRHPRRDRVPRPDVRLSARDARARPRVAAHRGRARRSRSSAPPAPGKSTLINLLPRLHEPPPGTVFIDGVDVREMPLAVLRGAIGFVPQEPFLFSDTIADNVAFGARRRSGRRRRRPADASTARRDRGRGGGRAARQGRRRLSRRATTRWSASAASRCRAARSSARPSPARSSIDPRILILDDALSAVDTYTEEEILSRLRGVMRQRTSIIVSHRISTVRDADQILVLDDGPHRRARHARRARRARAACTPSCTGSSCSKRSWRRS